MTEKQQPRKTYVKEVEDVIKLGYIDESTVLKLYKEIGKHFGDSIGNEEERGRENLRYLRKHERAYWHERIDDIVQWYDDRLSWRNVKVEPNRFKICPMPGCYRWFYDVARNGRTITCDYVEYKEWDFTNRKYKYRHDRYGNRISECAVNLDKYRRAAGGNYTDEDLLWPRYRRNVQEMPVDMQPSNGDAKGHAILGEMQKAYRRRA